MKDDDSIYFCLFLPIFFFLESVFLAPFISMPVGRRAMSMLIHGVELGNVTELVEVSSANFTVFEEVSRKVMLEREDPFFVAMMKYEHRPMTSAIMTSNQETCFLEVCRSG